MPLLTRDHGAHGVRALPVSTACLVVSLLRGFSQTVTTTPTFNNIGVVVDLPGPANGASVRMFVKSFGAPTNSYREAHPLSQLTPTRFAGSVFGLSAGTRYDLKLVSTAFASDQLVSPTTRSDTFPDATNATYHVSPITGNDTNSGLSFALAFRTLGHALAVANP